MAGIKESDFTCPIVGGPCRRGCPAAEQAIDRIADHDLAERIAGRVPANPTPKKKRQEELMRALFPRRLPGSSGKGLGEKCGRSPKKVR